MAPFRFVTDNIYRIHVISKKNPQVYHLEYHREVIFLAKSS